MKKVILVSAVLALLNQASYAEARDVRVTGGLSTGYDYYDRQQKGSTEPVPAEAEQGDEDILPVNSSGDEDDYEKIIVRPMIMFDVLSEKDSLQIRYEPGFDYDFDTEEDEINHKASVSAMRKFSKNWQVELSDNYEIRDDANEIGVVEDPTSAEGSGSDSAASTPTASSPDQLSTNLGRRRYTTNQLQLLSEYDYRPDSLFSLGYTYNLLRNEDDVDLSFQDYDKHDALVALDHRFDAIWRMSLSGHYIRGLYETPALDNPETAATVAETTDPNIEPAALIDDLSDDVTEYHTAIGLEYSSIPRHPLGLDYSRVAYDYDSELQDDSEIHNLTLNWQWLYSQHLTFNAGAGPTYVTTDNQDDTWGYNGNLGTDYQLKRGRINFSLLKGMERQNFTGQTIDNGLIEYWDANARFFYNLLESTSLSIFAGYRYEDQDDLPAVAILDSLTTSSADSADQLETITTKRFSTGCSLRYSFWQWYDLELSYNYADQTSELAADEFDEHQVTLVLSFAKEFFRW
jgi:hypothetical protein